MIGSVSESDDAVLHASLCPHGRLQWIGLRSTPRGAVRAVNHVEVLADHGLVGDHKARRSGGRRQVTLIRHEHLVEIATILGQPTLTPDLTRRNLVIVDISIDELRYQRFSIGEVVLEGTGDCDPCSRMEAALGAGGRNAMEGRGGITARVLKGGVIVVGDAVRPISVAVGDASVASAKS